ncbi:MAG: hypothetical protein ABJC89_07510 [Acidobacteriota bacterium]
MHKIERPGHRGDADARVSSARLPAASWVLVLFAAAASCSGRSGDRPAATYEPETGRLRALAFDANKNGKNDSVLYTDGKSTRRIELDLNENGKVERWDFYDVHGKLEKVGLSRRDDGVMDAEAVYTDAGALSEIRISTKRDGRYDRTEFYEHDVLVRSADDTVGDGKPHKWDTYQPDPQPAPGGPPSVITTTAIDETGAGRPTRRFTYGPDGAIVRVEVDRAGDGVFVPLAPAPERRR